MEKSLLLILIHDFYSYKSRVHCSLEMRPASIGPLSLFATGWNDEARRSLTYQLMPVGKWAEISPWADCVLLRVFYICSWANMICPWVCWSVRGLAWSACKPTFLCYCPQALITAQTTAQTTLRGFLKWKTQRKIHIMQHFHSYLFFLPHPLLLLLLLLFFLILSSV